MDITCNIVLADGKIIELDGHDKIYFLDVLPHIENSYSGYDLQSKQLDYYGAMNNLNNYNFIGIERDDSSHDLTFGGHDFVYKTYHQEIKKISEKNEILYLKTDCISTITVKEQWKK